MSENKNQATLIWAIFCQSVTVDSKTNAVSLFNVLEEIHVKIPEEKKPELENLKKTGFMLPINSVLSIYMKNSTDKKSLDLPIKLEIIDPNNTYLGGQEMVAKFEGKPNHRIFVNLNMFKVTTPGKYTFKISAQEQNSKLFSEIGSTSVLLNIE